MAAKLKPLLDKLLSPNQTGFLKGRSILHGFHYAQQIIQSATQQKIPIAIFKADIFKAFDTLDWTFLLDSLTARGFPLSWINAVRNNVLQGKSKVIINSVAGRYINLKRGVRQGDPISPYLFNLAADFLCRWIQKLNTLNFLTPPLPQCTSCLLYADDTLLFLKPTTNQVTKTKLLFHIFGRITVLRISLSKSEIFTTSSSFFLTQTLANVIQCSPKQFPISYLGLPLSDKRLTKTDYLPILEKIQKALAGWKAPLLSVAGRYILTNAVLSAIPQFLMSVFLLPKWVTRKIDQIRRKFLWHGHRNQHGATKGIYMVNWLLATRPRELGGLGVRNIEIANQTLLMKWMWLWTHQQHMWWKCATPMAELTDRPWEDPNATHFWRNMKSIVPAFNASVHYRVGNGQSVQFWNDNWLGMRLNLQFTALYQSIQNRHVSVSDSFHAGQWIFQHSQLSIDAQLQKQQLLAILQHVQLTHAPDEVTWLRDATGFSVSSAYKFMSYIPSPVSNLTNLWLIKAPLRVLIFAWLMLNNRLTTVDNLVIKGWHLTNMCILCRANEETVTHLFQCCPFTRQLRTYICAAFAQRYSIPSRFQAIDSTQMLTDKNEGLNVRQWELTTCFVIWRERCRRLFSDKQLPLVPLVREIRTEYASWFECSN